MVTSVTHAPYRDLREASGEPDPHAAFDDLDALQDFPMPPPGRRRSHPNPSAMAWRAAIVAALLGAVLLAIVWSWL